MAPASPSLRNWTTPFPPFDLGVQGKSVYERAGFEVNKSGRSSASLHWSTHSSASSLPPKSRVHPPAYTLGPPGTAHSGSAPSLSGYHQQGSQQGFPPRKPLRIDPFLANNSAANAPHSAPMPAGSARHNPATAASGNMTGTGYPAPAHKHNAPSLSGGYATFQTPPLPLHGPQAPQNPQNPRGADSFIFGSGTDRSYTFGRPARNRDSASSSIYDGEAENVGSDASVDNSNTEKTAMTSTSESVVSAAMSAEAGDPILPATSDPSANYSAFGFCKTNSSTSAVSDNEFSFSGNDTSPLHFPERESPCSGSFDSSRGSLETPNTSHSSVATTPPREPLHPININTRNSNSNSNSTSNPTCRGCHSAIEGKAVWSKDGKLTGKWHKDCFRCRYPSCGHKFTSREVFYVFSDAPYCERHYHIVNNSLCAACDSGIEGQCLENNVGQRFHVHCLVCHECGGPAVGTGDGIEGCDSEYFTCEGKIYCSAHGTNLNTDEKAEKRRTRIMFA